MGGSGERLWEENLIDAIIALPPMMFSHTAIQVAILILRKDSTDDGVLFVDAGRCYRHGQLRNVLRDSDVNAYHSRRYISRFTRLVTRKKIAANEFDLSVSRHLDATKEEPELDLAALRMERIQALAELASLETKMATLMKATGHG